MLSIKDLTYRIGGRLLFEDASAQIGARRRIGLVGRNGAGKSTLLGLIAGDISPDSGDVSLAAKSRLGRVEQHAPRGKRTPLEIVLAADIERAQLLEEAETATDPTRISDIHIRLADINSHSAPARAATILAGLGFDEAAQGRPVDSFSGGWRMRVNLAAALFTEPDLLLLDEPTNHLDIEAAMWLESYLGSYRYGFVLVSHDRALLNRSVDGILHLENGSLTLYPGGYDRFERTRSERLAHLAHLQKKQDAERQHIQTFVDRFRYKATKARQAQSRLKMLERMQPIALAVREETVNFEFPVPQELPPPLITTYDIAVGYQPGAPILSNLSLRIDTDDRIGLIGENGNGKSTLMKFLCKQLQHETGDITRSGKLRTGYFAQDQLDQLNARETAYQHITALMPRKSEPERRAHLGRFGFAQEKADLVVDQLSGGERARLVLATICCDAPQLLLLDEPTNHLDVDARESLLRALNDFAGAVVLVTHDPHLLSLTVDQLWLVANGTCTPYDGDVESYRTTLLRAKQSRSRPANGKAAKGSSKLTNRRERAQQRAALVPLRQAVREAEKRLEILGTEMKEIERRLGDPEFYNGAAPELPALNKRKATVERELAAVEERWLAAQNALDAASSADG